MREENKNNNSLTLDEWIKGKNQDDIIDLFFNMDLTMKYLHNHNHCIQSFMPKDIFILNDSIKEIKFNQILKMPDDYDLTEKMKNEDIYSFAFLQIGLFSNCLEYLKPNFLKENFESFLTFLPQDYVPYYRGIIERGFNVYFSEFVVKLKTRKFNELSQQFGEENNDINNQNLNFDSYINSNYKINDNIYQKINKRSDAAFVGTLIFPILIAVVGMVMFLISGVIKMS